MSERMAPEGAIWVCGACGKTHEDQYGMRGKGSYGWDESCLLNAVLCSVSSLRYSGSRVTHADPFEPIPDAPASTETSR